MPDGMLTTRRREGGSPNDAGRLAVELVEAALNSEFAAVRTLGAKLVAACGGGERGALEAQLAQIIQGRSGRPTPAFPHATPKSGDPALEERSWPSEPLFLQPEHASVLDRFVTVAREAERLASAGLAPKNNLLLVGPPGIGKTLIAGHLAARLGLPFHVVRLDGIMSSLLGDTAKNIRKVFDRLQSSGGFVFLDEVDAIAKQRNDSHDVGELKRVVNTLLQGLDHLDHRCVVVAATNHPELLDRAVWRRFPYHLHIEAPDAPLRRSLWEHYLPLPAKQTRCLDALAQASEGLSCSDIAEIALAARRIAFLDETDISLPIVLNSIVSCKSGRFMVPATACLEPDTRDKLVAELHDSHGVPRNQLPALFGVSRQMIDKCLRHARDPEKLTPDLGRQTRSLAEN